MSTPNEQDVLANIVFEVPNGLLQKTAATVQFPPGEGPDPLPDPD